MSNRHVYIGIETKVREFEAKMLLACVAAEAGFDVKLGKLKIFRHRLQTMPRGIFFEKSITGERIPQYRLYNRLGFCVIGHDEEGLSPWNAEEYLRTRKFSDDSLRYVDNFMAWGQWHADVVAQAAPSFQSKILPVGHPRGDMTRKALRGFYDEEVRKLRERYGRLILINTNFALCNHFYGRDGMFEFYRKSGRALAPLLEKFYRGVQQHQEKLFSAFTDMITAIYQRFPDASIVVRPHPSENHDTWRKLLPQSPNIHVIHEGNVVHWLLAADVMIHNSCTTGIEGVLLERPVIAYRPVQDTQYESYLPNALSVQTDSVKTVLRHLEQIFTNPSSFHLSADEKERQNLLQGYVTALDGPLSCDRIVEKFTHLALPPRTVSMTAVQLRETLRGLKGRLANRVRRQSEQPLHAGSQYRQQKFPGIELAEVEDALTKFQLLLGRFSAIHITELEPNLFRIYS